MSNITDTLSGLFASNSLEPFIRTIRFPKYKNLSRNLSIDFNFPLTALVGPNGTNKSSILRALYSCPDQYNLGSFWFSSKIDPIQEGGGERNCYIHAYRNLYINKVVEVLKTRSLRKDDPDYWETARPQKQYGMDLMPEYDPTKSIGRSKTRWDSIKKSVIYIDFRSALSAFDKFFYHTDFKSTTRDKRDKIRKVTPHLKKVINDKLTSHFYCKKERIVNAENRTLTIDECNEISKILGRKYSGIHLLRHAFFTEDAYTCVLTTPNMSYSEAFAGSGEFAVVKLVTEIMAAPKKSLILLDEPEVSLHPGAQSRLLDFILEQIKVNHHQVVMSTHSTHLIKNLPPQAIKVLLVEAISGNIILEKQESHPSEAFFHLGEILEDKKTILVEDKLSCEIIKRITLEMGEAIDNILEVKWIPGGASAMWNLVKSFSIEERENLIIFFDGDMETLGGIPDETNIPSADNNKLKDIIFKFTSMDIAIPVDGNKNTGANYDQLIKFQRSFISWAYKNVNYLPGKCIPEKLIWEKMTHDETTSKITDEDYKNRFEKLARSELNYPNFRKLNSGEIFETQKRKIAGIDSLSKKIPEITDVINSFLGRKKK